MNDDRTPHRRFRVRISTLLFLIVIAALISAIIVQQVQIEQLRRSRQAIANIVREQRDYIERQKAKISAQPGPPCRQARAMSASATMFPTKSPRSRHSHPIANSAHHTRKPTIARLERYA